MIYTQPKTFLNWLSLIIVSVSLSLIMGAIFWDIPTSDPQLNLNDRLGYHYSTMSVIIWPIALILTLMEVRRNRRTVQRDIDDDLYGRFTYIMTKVSIFLWAICRKLREVNTLFFQTIVNIFPSLFVWLIYLVPSYSMSGLYMQGTGNYKGFYIYLGSIHFYIIFTKPTYRSFCFRSNVIIFKLCTNIYSRIYISHTTFEYSHIFRFRHSYGGFLRKRIRNSF